jgi:hypothetical protein
MMARRRRLGWVLMLLVAVAVVVVAVWAWRSHRSVEVAVAPRPGNPSMPASAAAIGAAEQGSARALKASSPSVAPSDAPVASAPVAALARDDGIPPEGLEVCGVRRVAAEELRRWKADPAHGQAQAELIEASMQRNTEAGLSRIAARLAAGSERQQVAARLLMGDRDGAALLAERSNDAQAYQMALTYCGAAGEAAPHCARLTPRRWAELDPSDARPWLRMMEAARRRNDAAGVDAALAEAAARPRLSRGSFLLEAHAVGVADVIPDAAALGGALIAVIGIDAAAPALDLAAPARACKGEGLRDAARLGHCRELARMVLGNTSDLGEAMLAQVLAQRSGLPREQQAYDAATLKEAQDLYSIRALQSVGMDCASMRKTRQLSAERAGAGELAMALALLPARTLAPRDVSPPAPSPSPPGSPGSAR